MENTKYLLEMSNITKEFPGVKALGIIYYTEKAPYRSLQAPVWGFF